MLFVRDKNFWKIFERTKYGPKGEGQEARNKNANNANTTKVPGAFCVLCVFRGQTNCLSSVFIGVHLWTVVVINAF